MYNYRLLPVLLLPALLVVVSCTPTGAPKDGLSADSAPADSVLAGQDSAAAADSSKDTDTGPESGTDTGSETGSESGSPETASPETGDSGEESSTWPITEDITCYSAMMDYTLGEPEIVSILLSTGAMSVVTPLDGGSEDVYNLSSLGLEDETLFGCSLGDDGLYTYDLTLGHVVHAGTPCDAAARWSGDSAYDGSVVLLDMYFADFRWYADLDHAVADEEVTILDATPGSISRITISEDTLYGVWHSTDQFEVVSLLTGDTHSVRLEGYDDWIMGLSVVDGVLIVLDQMGDLYAFDADTGEALAVLSLDHDPYGQPLYGLTCVVEDDAEPT